MLKATPQHAPDGQPFRLITLRNSAGMVITMMDWGATLLSCRIPMKDGRVRETLLGCSTPEAYLRQDAWLGATIGRYANRIANGQLIDKTNQPIQLHGGTQGFDKRRWRIIRYNEQEIFYALDSADGDQGFPGNVHVTAHYAVTEDNCIAIKFCAETDKPCPVNLTNHAYFNLDCEQNDVRQHRLQLFAGYYLPIDSNGIPAKNLKDVAGTGFDFRQAKIIAKDFKSDSDQQLRRGYDHAFLLQTQGRCDQPAAHLWSSDNLLQMTVFTSAPALQVYSGNFLAGTSTRGHAAYRDYQGIALESGFLPDSPNHPEWPQPDCWLQPDEKYISLTAYQFITH